MPPRRRGEVKPAGQIRQSQVVTTFGPGAMVDLPEYAVIIGGLDHWSGYQDRPVTEERLAAKVKANESGCLMYQLTKSRTEPNVYKVLELYASQDALTAHGQTEYFKAAGPGIGACLGGRPSIEYLDAV